MINVQIDSADLSTVADILDIEREQFEDAQGNEHKEPHENWEALLNASGGYSEIIQCIDRVKRNIEDGSPA